MNIIKDKQKELRELEHEIDKQKSRLTKQFEKPADLVLVGTILKDLYDLKQKRLGLLTELILNVSQLHKIEDQKQHYD